MEHTVDMEQPERIYRFRYASEKATHGALSGEKKDQPPKISWIIPAEYANDELWALVSLYEENSNCPCAPFKLSPHTLWEGSKKCENDEILYKPYFKPMVKKENKATLIVKGCYISSVKKQNTIVALRQKYKKLTEEKLLTVNDLNEEQQMEQEIQYERQGKKTNKKINPGEHQSVRLGYTIFTADKQYIAGPFLSEPIANADPLKINRICPAIGSSEGGEDVVLLVNKISEPKSIEIRVFEVVDNTTNWNKTIGKQKLNFHGQQAILTKMPKYNGENRNTDVECRVEIISFGLRSEPVTYVYRKTNLKRKRSDSPRVVEGEMPTFVDEGQSLPKQLFTTDGVQIYSRDVSNTDIENKTIVEQMVKEIKKITEQKSINIKEKLDAIRDLMKSLQFENGDTIFHAALEDKIFLKIKFLFENFSVLLREAINNDNQNLLHYACESNQYDHIRALIGCGVAIHASDNSNNTPLHIAIGRQRNDCIIKFAQIIKDPNAYPEQLKADIERLLSAYDRLGYTVLHLAVINDMRDLVKAILIFCKNQGLDACTMRVLGNGDTIMHLAMARKLKDMAKLIAKHIPDAKYYRNYAMDTTSDSFEKLCEDISEISKLQIN